MEIDKRKYLKPETIATLANMQLRARMVVEGFIVGLHKSPYHGFSVEFAEHRAYGPGDDLRHMDWKLYGKTDRFYIKQFEEETNLKAHLLIDVSKSMSYGSGSVTKIQYASFLAAALTYLMLHQQDAVGLTLFDSEIRQHLRPSSRPSTLNAILSQLEGIVPGPETAVGESLHHLAERINRRGLVIVISDLFDEPEKILSGLKHFRHDNHEVILFHILDPQEVNFSFDAHTKFYDMESGDMLATEPWHIQKAYQNAVQKFCDVLKQGAREQNSDYVQLTTDQPLDLALSSYLNKRRRLH